MGGSDSLRGYVIQTMVSILEAFQSDNEWESFVLEPDDESEKVDIKWLLPQRVKRVVQVKSSKNRFKLKNVQAWCNELKDSVEADSYELYLVGPHLDLKKKEFERVVIHQRELNIDTMLVEVAHYLDKYCEDKEIPSISASRRELLAEALITRFEFKSIQQRTVSRAEFDNWLKQRSFFTLPQINDTQAEPLFETIKATSKTQSVTPDPWIQTLWLKELHNLSDKPKKYRLQDLLSEADKKTILVGRSGSGKTCTMKMAANILNEDPQNVCFWIPLKVYSRSLENTVKRLLGWYELSDDKVIPMLQKHRIILLLDGLNEVSERQREQCEDDIQQWLLFDRVSFWVSYSTADRGYFSFDAPTYEIMPLEKDQIDHIVKAFYEDAGNPEKADWILEVIKRADRENRGSEKVEQSFYSVLQTPLHIQFLFELAEGDDFRYKILRDLHGQIIEKRLERIGQRVKSSKTSTDIKTQCLMNLAYRSIIEDRNLQMSKAFVKEVFTACAKSAEEGALVLEELLRNDLLIEINQLLVEWLHPSFRDYLAGRYLFELEETGKPLEEFPFGNPQANTAVAYAVGLFTSQPVRLPNRHRIFLSLLHKRPPFEAVHAVAMEYDISNEISDCKDFKCAEAECKQYKWGERFLEAYQLIADMAQWEKFSTVARIPHPQGLLIFFSATADFCLIMFTDVKGIYFSPLATFEAVLTDMKKQGIPCVGFCLHAPFLLLLDPEIMAYLQVGTWLRLRASKDGQSKLAQWHEGLSTYIRTPNDWISWGKISKPPESRSDERTQPRKALLTWGEFYVPVTFQIDPVEIQTPPKFVSNRLSEVMFVAPPPHHISLGLLMSWSPKVDLGTSIFVPFPVPLFNRYYFLYSSVGSMVSDDFLTFAHLRG